MRILYYITQTTFCESKIKPAFGHIPNGMALCFSPGLLYALVVLILDAIFYIVRNSNYDTEAALNHDNRLFTMQLW